jgi:hypothetical protein
MFVDASGSVGLEHARDMRRAAAEHRVARAAHRGRHAFRGFIARGQLGPVHNYRVR